MAVVTGTGDQQHAAAAPTAHVPVWLSLEVSRYKQVSCAANGKRAKKTIWTWEGIWAGLGVSPVWYCPWPPLSNLLALELGIRYDVVFKSSPLPFGKSKTQ